jgi:hypothetical protein
MGAVWVCEETRTLFVPFIVIYLHTHTHTHTYFVHQHGRWWCEVCSTVIACTFACEQRRGCCVDASGFTEVW